MAKMIDQEQRREQLLKKLQDSSSDEAGEFFDKLPTKGLNVTIHIRTRDKCPNCEGKFVLTKGKDGEIFVCETCLRKGKVVTARTHYLDFQLFGKKSFVYASKDGEPLTSYETALRASEEVSEDIRQRRFNLTAYRVRNISFAAYANEWLEAYRGRYRRGEISKGTIDKAQYYVTKCFIPYFADKVLSKIGSVEIDGYFSTISDLGANTRHNYARFLKFIFTSAHTGNVIGSIPDFPTIRPQQGTINWLTREEQDRVLECIPQEHKPIFIFLLKMGVRPNEARALRWESVNFRSSSVFIKDGFSGSSKQVFQNNTKGHKQLHLPMPDEVCKILHDLWDKNRKGTGFVFTIPHRAKGEVTIVPYYKGKLNLLWNEAVKQAGLPHTNLYGGSRHSWISQRLNAGMSLGLISKWVGHSDPGFTARVYAHSSLEGLRSLIDEGPGSGSDGPAAKM